VPNRLAPRRRSQQQAPAHRLPRMLNGLGNSPPTADAVGGADRVPVASRGGIDRRQPPLVTPLGTNVLLSHRLRSMRRTCSSGRSRRRRRCGAHRWEVVGLWSGPSVFPTPRSTHEYRPQARARAAFEHVTSARGAWPDTCALQTAHWTSSAPPTAGFSYACEIGRPLRELTVPRRPRVACLQVSQRPLIAEKTRQPADGVRSTGGQRRGAINSPDRIGSEVVCATGVDPNREPKRVRCRWKPVRRASLTPARRSSLAASRIPGNRRRVIHVGGDGDSGSRRPRRPCRIPEPPGGGHSLGARQSRSRCRTLPSSKANRSPLRSQVVLHQPVEQGTRLACPSTA